jgi:hypothetical protein
MNDIVKTVLERYGLPTLLCIAGGYFLRTDVLLPLVEQHSAFLRTIAESQKDIATAVQEQTRLLYALQPKAAEEAKSYKVSVEGSR